MKKNLLAISLILSLIIQSRSYAQLPNGGFENWTSVSYQNPTGWFTGNQKTISRMGVACVTRVTGSTGYGLRIETKIIGQDTSDSYITNSIGDPLAGDGGVPYPAQPTRISGQYRCNLVGNDTALLVVIFKSAGVIISTDIFKFTGNHSTFTSFLFPLSVSLMPDTMIMAATSSNLLSHVGVHSASFLELDALDFQILPVIPNGNFENWDSVTYETPAGWEINGDSISKTTDHFGGSYAIRMVTQDYGGGNISSANITTGHNSQNGPGGGLPYTLMSDTLVGYYKFITSGSDSANAGVTLTNNGSMVGGNGRFLPPAASYTYFQIPIMASSTPDTMRIDFSSSKYPYSPSSVGSMLYLDGLRLKSTPVGIPEINKTHSNMIFSYPNPASDMLNIVFKQNPEADFDILVYNISGSLVKTEHFKSNASSYSLPVSDLQAGTYYFESVGKTGRLRNTFIKQ